MIKIEFEYVEEQGNVYEIKHVTEEVEGRIRIVGTIKNPKKEYVEEKTQLDRIEEAISIKNSDIAAAAIDEYTLQLMEGGVL